MSNESCNKKLKNMGECQMYKNVIVKTPGKSYVNGLTTSDLGKPDYEKLLVQHENYIEALKKVWRSCYTSSCKRGIPGFDVCRGRCRIDF